ncbi:MAG: DNA polymerase III subunit epsilon, partial [Geminicoccaceae bacterium]
NHLPTGRVFHEYVNPERDMPAEAEKIHGISRDFLADKPVFSDVVNAFLAFLEEDGEGAAMPGTLVIHNAAFDIKFLNSELTRLGHAAIEDDHRVIDSLQLARQKFPGAPASLDALCRRFDVDTSARTKHGALLDSELLAEVYLGLIGGRQPGLNLAINVDGREQVVRRKREPKPARAHAPSEAELCAHEQFLDRIKDPLWKQ